MLLHFNETPHDGFGSVFEGFETFENGFVVPFTVGGGAVATVVDWACVELVEPTELCVPDELEGGAVARVSDELEPKEVDPPSLPFPDPVPWPVDEEVEDVVVTFGDAVEELQAANSTEPKTNNPATLKGLLADILAPEMVSLRFRTPLTSGNSSRLVLWILLLNMFEMMRYSSLKCNQFEDLLHNWRHFVLKSSQTYSLIDNFFRNEIHIFFNLYNYDDEINRLISNQLLSFFKAISKQKVRKI